MFNTALVSVLQCRLSLLPPLPRVYDRTFYTEWQGGIKVQNIKTARLKNKKKQNQKHKECLSNCFDIVE